MTDIPLDSIQTPALNVGGGVFDAVAVFCIIFFAILLIAIFVIVLKKMRKKPELYGLTREEIRKKWDALSAISQQQGAMGLKMAIVEADSLFDGILKSLMMPGSDMGERLRAACYKYPELKKVWFAHRLRNQIVHETTFQIDTSEGKEAMRTYERGLKVLRML
jgi:hypothetical protein